MRRCILSLLAVGSLAFAAADEWYESADFGSWDPGKVEKFLEKSPWVKTTTYRPSNPAAMRQIGANEGRGQATVFFRVRWFSARPVRMAMARQALALNPQLKVEQLSDFALSPSEQVIVAVVLDGNDAALRSIRGYQSALQRLDTETVLPLVTLQTKADKEIHPVAYQPPDPERQSSAKFVFPRALADGRPLLEPADKEARFRFTFEAGRNDKVRIDAKFKLEDMLFQGELEY